MNKHQSKPFDSSLKVNFSEMMLDAGLVNKVDQATVDLRMLQAQAAKAYVIRWMRDIGIDKRQFPEGLMDEFHHFMADPLYANLVLQRDLHYGSDVRLARLKKNSNYELVRKNHDAFHSSILLTKASESFMKEGQPLRELWEDSKDIIPLEVQSLWKNIATRSRKNVQKEEELATQLNIVEDMQESDEDEGSPSDLFVTGADLICEDDTPLEEEEASVKKKKRKKKKRVVRKLSPTEVWKVLKPRKRR